MPAIRSSARIEAVVGGAACSRRNSLASAWLTTPWRRASMSVRTRSAAGVATELEDPLRLGRVLAQQGGARQEDGRFVSARIGRPRLARGLGRFLLELHRRQHPRLREPRLREPPLVPEPREARARLAEPCERPVVIAAAGEDLGGSPLAHRAGLDVELLGEGERLLDVRARRGETTGLEGGARRPVEGEPAEGEVVLRGADEVPQAARPPMPSPAMTLPIPSSRACIARSRSARLEGSAPGRPAASAPPRSRCRAAASVS